MASGNSSDLPAKSGENPYLHQDQLDLISALITRNVRFLLVGGHAYTAYAAKRATKDIDLWIEPTPDNAQRVYAALADFGAPLIAHEVKPDDFTDRGSFYQLGQDPDRVDLLTDIANLDFDDAYSRRIEATLGGLRMPVIGLDDLIYAKRVAGRPQDLVDLDVLLRVKARLEKKAADEQR